MTANFDHYNGSDQTIRITLTDENGSAVDASSASAALFELKHSSGTISKTLGGGIAVGTGDIVISLAIADTTGLVAQTGTWRCRLTLGGEAQTVQWGNVEMNALA